MHKNVSSKNDLHFHEKLSIENTSGYFWMKISYFEDLKPPMKISIKTLSVHSSGVFLLLRGKFAIFTILQYISFLTGMTVS